MTDDRNSSPDSNPSISDIVERAVLAERARIVAALRKDQINKEWHAIADLLENGQL